MRMLARARRARAGEADSQSALDQGGGAFEVARAEPEVDGDRVELLDRGQVGKGTPAGLVRPNQVADLDPSLADPASQRSVHPAVAQVQLGVADGGLGGRELRL